MKRFVNRKREWLKIWWLNFWKSFNNPKRLAVSRMWLSMYSVVKIHSRYSGSAIFAGHKQMVTHATLPRRADSGQCSVGGHTWERAIMPRCRRVCSPTLGGERRGRPGERGRVNLSQLIIGRLLLAAIVCHLLVTSKGNDAYRSCNLCSHDWNDADCLHGIHTFILSPLQCNKHQCGLCRTLNKIWIVPNELWMFK